jgi:hypothetical protein
MSKRKWMAGAVALCVCVAAQSMAKELSVLTIGASFWSAGGASFKVLDEMLEARGYSSVTESALGLPGYFRVLKIFETGVGLETLTPSENKESYKKLAQKCMDSCEKGLTSREWDYACIMAHSSSPFAENTEASIDAYMEELIRIKSPRTRLVVTMTWVKDPKKQDYETIRNYYRRIADRYNALLAPSGDAFEIVEKERPDIPIFRSSLESYQSSFPGKTDRHPSVYGQYLNSCVVFAVVTGESPVGLPCKLSDAIKDDFRDKEGNGLGTPMDIPPDVAEYLQQVAWRVVQAAGKTAQTE